MATSIRAKAAAESAPSAPQLSAIDFSEFRHYVDQLSEAQNDDDRRECARIIAQLCQTLPQPQWGDDLANEAWRYATFGEESAPLRQALLRVVEAHAGFMAVPLIAKEMEAEKRRIDRQNGAKGGNVGRFDKEWLAEYERLRAKYPDRSDWSDTSIFHLIHRTWVSTAKETAGEKRSWQAIRDGVKREQRRRNNPDGTPPLPT